MHHGDGITHINYLFHFKPFVEHEILDFGLYLGAGIGMIFWAPARRGYRCYDPPGPDDYRCDYDYDYYYYRSHWYGGRYRDRGGVALTARPPSVSSSTGRRSPSTPSSRAPGPRTSSTGTRGTATSA